MVNECSKSALQIAIDKIHYESETRCTWGDDCIQAVPTDFAIQVLEELEVALTDCYKEK
jgi:Na+-translocating ferredoxin:NAD+ oxidoreductase RNF subunit RnfB